MDSANSFQNKRPVLTEDDASQAGGICREDEGEGGDKKCSTIGDRKQNLLGVPHPPLPENLGAAVNQMLVEFHAAVEEKMAVIVEQFGGKHQPSTVEEQASVTQGAAVINPKKRLRAGDVPCSSAGRWL